MVGRGEFAYLVAETSSSTELESKVRSSDYLTIPVFSSRLSTPFLSPPCPLQNDGTTLMTDKVFSIVVWALLWSTIVAPLSFKYVLQHRLKHTLIRRSSSIGKRNKRGTFKIKMEGRHHTGLLVEVCNVLHSLSLDVVEANVETDGDIDADIFTVRLRDGADLDDDKIEEIRHAVLEVRVVRCTLLPLHPRTRNLLPSPPLSLPNPRPSTTRKARWCSCRLTTTRTRW